MGPPGPTDAGQSPARNARRYPATVEVTDSSGRAASVW
jgi:hypothetical protein